MHVHFNFEDITKIYVLRTCNRCNYSIYISRYVICIVYLHIFFFFWLSRASSVAYVFDVAVSLAKIRLYHPRNFI